MRHIKKLTVTLVGGFLLLIGLIFIIVPGPAVLVIPLALAILSTEYPSAKVWLRKFQRSLRASSRWLDSKIKGFKSKRRAR
jgi:hypothetical protein